MAATPERIVAGTPLEVRDALNQWHPAVATSGVEGEFRTLPNGRRARWHDFPVVWVRFNRGGPVPWPVEDVRAV